MSQAFHAVFSVPASDLEWVWNNERVCLSSRGGLVSSVLF